VLFFQEDNDNFIKNILSVYNLGSRQSKIKKNEMFNTFLGQIFKNIYFFILTSWNALTRLEMRTCICILHYRLPSLGLSADLCLPGSFDSFDEQGLLGH